MERLADNESSMTDVEIETILKEVLEKDQINKNAIQRLIALRIRRGKYEEAITLLKKYTEVYVESQAYVQLAELLCHLGRYDEASKQMEMVLMAEPQNFYTWEFAGEIEYKRKNIPEARKMFLAACKLSDYKYLRAVKAVLVVLNESKDMKTKSTFISEQLTKVCAELEKQANSRKVEFLNHY